MKIVNFGSLNIDHVFQVENIVQPGQTISSLDRVCFPGGKGLNQSLAMARAGAKVYHAGNIGEDGTGLQVLLENSGVDCSHLRVVQEDTGCAFIQVDTHGQNCIVVTGGANRANTHDYCSRVLQTFHPGDMVVLQNEINCVDHIIKQAYELGMYIVLNPSPLDDNILSCDLSKVAFLILNLEEGERLSGQKTPNGIISALSRQYPAAEIVMTLGADGAIYTDGVQRVTQPAYQADVVDTTGAGDTFTGYLLAGIAEGKPIAECLRMATVAASIAVARQGAASSIPDLAEVKLACN